MSMADRRNWRAVKRSRKNTAARQDAYQSAKDAFALAERVRQAREKLGITQTELAARIGSTQPAVARLEAGGVSPSLDTLRKIADALGFELVVELRVPRRASA
jgi:ribosome-binding protein aMBF1 (putative translation factor)